VQKTGGAVHIGAAKRNHSTRDAPKEIHDFPSLGPIAQDAIYNHLRNKSPQFLLVLRNLASFAQNVLNGIG
jgi:hypothetical protein